MSQWSWSSERLVDRLTIRISEGEFTRLWDLHTKVRRKRGTLAREAFLRGLAELERDALSGAKTPKPKDAA